MAIVSDDYRREQELLRKDPIILGMAVGLGDISLDEISHPNGTPTHGFMGAANKRYHDQAGKHSMSIGGVGAAVIHVLKSMRAADAQKQKPTAPAKNTVPASETILTAFERAYLDNDARRIVEDGRENPQNRRKWTPNKPVRGHGTYSGRLKVRGVLDIPNQAPQMTVVDPYTSRAYTILFRPGEVSVYGTRVLKPSGDLAQEVFRCAAASGQCPPKLIPILASCINRYR
ncbi:MAG: hypothetical protein E6R04_11060 [Spirochaetes bacterium]|nr:MAG: hypothetical protein E6R04_11060 [Spirochaetota bacterium]